MSMTSDEELRRIRKVLKELGDNDNEQMEELEDREELEEKAWKYDGLSKQQISIMGYYREMEYR